VLSNHEEPGFGLLEIGGADAEQFLHAQLATDVKQHADGAVFEAALLSAQGRVLCTGPIWRVSAQLFLWLLPDALCASTRQHLLRYKLRSKIALEIGLLPCIRVLPDWSDAAGRNWNPSTSTLPMDQAARLHALRKGVFSFSQDHVDRFLPDALGITERGAISLKKGCYPGQEIVARLHYLGRGKRHIQLLESDLEPDLRHPIANLSGQSIGEWLVIESDEQKWLGLAVVSDTARGPLRCTGTGVELRVSS
jgi:hypothetical protein